MNSYEHGKQEAPMTTYLLNDNITMILIASTCRKSFISSNCYKFLAKYSSLVRTILHFILVRMVENYLLLLMLYLVLQVLVDKFATTVILIVNTAEMKDSTGVLLCIIIKRH